MLIYRTCRLASKTFLGWLHKQDYTKKCVIG